MFSAIKSALRIIGAALVGYLLYAVSGGVARYWFPKRVSREEQCALDEVEFRGDGVGLDRVCLIETPEDAWAVRMALIREANETLDVAVHLIKRGACAEPFLGELARAADRGVQVRLLVDAKTCLLSGDVKRALAALDRHPNAQVSLFNPVRPLKPWTWQVFLHDKFMVVDGNLLLLGGRNIDERHYAPKGYERPITHDRDVLIWKSGCGDSSVDQAMAYFEELMATGCGRPRQMDAMSAVRVQERLMNEALLFQADNPEFYTRRLWRYLETSLPTARVTLIRNPIHGGKKSPWVGYQLMRLALAAERVLVQTPYATGNRQLIRALGEVSRRVPLTMITNSLTSSPNYPAFSNYFFQRHKFLNTGARIYEYQREDSIHGKSMVFDDRLSAVGSFNLDDRSMFINTETMLVIDSAQFAGQLADVMDGLIAQSRPVTNDRDSHDAHSASKLGAMFATNLLLRPFQYLL